MWNGNDRPCGIRYLVHPKQINWRKNSMSINEIISVVLGILWIAAGFIAKYYKGNSKLTALASEAIAKAEAEFTGAEQGEAKMAFAVDWIYTQLPAVFKIFVSKEMVQDVIQEGFNNISAYAKLQLDKAVDKLTGTTSPDTAETSATEVASASTGTVSAQ
jgi:hypothetical protein